LVAGTLAAEVCAMAGYAPFASLLVELSRLWRLEPAHAGWISSAYLIGYALAVPMLVGMTDRVDARAIYVAGSALGVIGGAGFAWFAHGFFSAFIFRAIAGMALAGTYMPGLRILTERLAPRARIRSVPYYTAMFGVGASLSFWISGWAAQRCGWSGAFWAGAIGSAAAGALVLLGTVAIPRAPDLDGPPPAIPSTSARCSAIAPRSPTFLPMAAIHWNCSASGRGCPPTCCSHGRGLATDHRARGSPIGRW